MKSYFLADLPIHPIQKGDKVKIPKGTMVRGTSPKSPYITKREYTVTVFDVFSPGYEDCGLYVRPAVCWVGSGGYWMYADMDQVEKKPEAHK